jgi:hypothetical protein
MTRAGPLATWSRKLQLSTRTSRYPALSSPGKQAAVTPVPAPAVLAASDNCHQVSNDTVQLGQEGGRAGTINSCSVEAELSRWSLETFLRGTFVLHAMLCCVALCYIVFSARPFKPSVSSACPRQPPSPKRECGEGTYQTKPRLPISPNSLPLPPLRSPTPFPLCTATLPR